MRVACLSTRGTYTSTEPVQPAGRLSMDKIWVALKEFLTTLIQKSYQWLPDTSNLNEVP